jgi:hypothetical protein
MGYVALLREPFITDLFTTGPGCHRGWRQYGVEECIQNFPMNHDINYYDSGTP